MWKGILGAALLAAAVGCGNGAEITQGSGGGGPGGMGQGGGALPAPIPVVRLDAEEGYTCAWLTEDSACWRTGEPPQVFAGRAVADEVPAAIGESLPELPDTLNGFLGPTLDAGGGDACIVSADANPDVWCTGAGQKVGEPTGEPWWYLTGGETVSVSKARVCVVANGSAVCTTGDWSTLPNVAALDSGAAVDVAITKDGDVYFWDGGTDLELMLSDATDVAAGGQHACAIAAGEVWCWGAGASGQLATSNTSSLVPRLVPLPHPATLIAAGEHHSCAYTAAGHVWCWGDGDPVPRVVEL